MAINPMPVPTADPYAAYNTDKTKKKKQTATSGVTNTVTTPQKQHGGSKAPVQKSYSYTETKPTANTGTAVKTNTAAGEQAITGMLQRTGWAMNRTVIRHNTNHR